MKMILKFVDIIPLPPVKYYYTNVIGKVTGYVIKIYMAEMDGAVHYYSFAAVFTVLKHCIRLYRYNLENGHRCFYPFQWDE